MFSRAKFSSIERELRLFIILFYFHQCILLTKQQMEPYGRVESGKKKNGMQIICWCVSVYIIARLCTFTYLFTFTSLMLKKQTEHTLFVQQITLHIITHLFFFSASFCIPLPVGFIFISSSILPLSDQRRKKKKKNHRADCRYSVTIKQNIFILLCRLVVFWEPIKFNFGA